MPNPNPSRWRPSDRRVVLAVTAVVVGCTGFAAGAWGLAQPTDREPLVTFRQVVPDDVESEAEAAVAAFTDRFAARRDCIGGADVVLVEEVAGGDARYVASDATIEIEIPTSPRRFRESLIHELAHHVEHTCAEFDALRTRLLTLTGADAWSGQARWVERPAEQWAEAVVAATLGERVRFGRSMPLDPAIVDAVLAWATRG